MNRQQRRKAAKVSELRMKPVRELVAAGHRCAGAGCEASFEGDMPPGWRWVVYYWAPRPEMPEWTALDWVQKPYRDICLCPEHARAFDALLINFGDAVAGPPAGNGMEGWAVRPRLTTDQRRSGPRPASGRPARSGGASAAWAKAGRQLWKHPND